jgi:uncharacterized protein (DUF433 family)
MEQFFAAYPSISVDPNVCFGKPCIKGTRIPVSSLLSYISGGMSIEVLLKEFPSLTNDDVMQAIAFAAETVDYRIIPLKAA